MISIARSFALGFTETPATLRIESDKSANKKSEADSSFQLQQTRKAQYFLTRSHVDSPIFRRYAANRAMVCMPEGETGAKIVFTRHPFRLPSFRIGTAPGLSNVDRRYLGLPTYQLDCT